MESAGIFRHSRWNSIRPKYARAWPEAYANRALVCLMWHEYRNSSSYRGHSSSFEWTQCETHLCIRTYHGMRWSCWDMWNYTKRLEQREMEGRRNVSPGRSDRLSEELNCMGEILTPQSGRRGQKRLPDDSRRPCTRCVRKSLSIDIRRCSYNISICTVYRTHTNLGD